MCVCVFNSYKSSGITMLDRTVCKSSSDDSSPSSSRFMHCCCAIGESVTLRQCSITVMHTSFPGCISGHERQSAVLSQCCCVGGADADADAVEAVSVALLVEEMQTVIIRANA